MTEKLRVGTWNMQWRRPGTPDADFMLARLFERNPEVLCLTEVYPETLSTKGYIISCDADHGYSTSDGRRKVILWSERPWHAVDPIGDPELPSGRFVAGTTETSLGPIRFMGVCIPWKDAHVRSGRQDADPWDEHKSYLRGLGKVIEQSEEPLIVVGDFNQRVPRKYTPPEVHSLLLDTLTGKLEVMTGGDIPRMGIRSIDHLACSRSLEATEVNWLSNVNGEGREVSDHIGIAVALRKKPE